MYVCIYVFICVHIATWRVRRMRCGWLWSATCIAPCIIALQRKAPQELFEAQQQRMPKPEYQRTSPRTLTRNEPQVLTRNHPQVLTCFTGAKVKYLE